MVEEDLLIDHPIDCPICDKAGECHCRTIISSYGQKQRRADIRPFTSRRREMGDTVTLFVDRCVMCSRCVRFTREISGTARTDGHQPRQPRRNRRLSRLSAGQQAVRQRGRSVPGRGAGRQGLSLPAAGLVHEAARRRLHRLLDRLLDLVEENQDRVYRLKPRENPHVNQWWMCDEGRYGYHHVHSDQRLVESAGGASTDVRSTLEWPALLDELDAGLRKAGPPGRRALAALDGRRGLPAGQVRPADRSAGAVAARARCRWSARTSGSPTALRFAPRNAPTAAASEMIVAHFMGRVPRSTISWPELAAGEIRGVWVTGGYKRPTGSTRPPPRASSGSTLLVVQDMFHSPLWQRADLSACPARPSPSAKART